MADEATLDMHDSLQMLDELRDKISDLDGTTLNVEVRSKTINAEKAEINRRLLYLAHLADMVRADLMSQYHRFKGEDPPYVTT